MVVSLTRKVDPSFASFKKLESTFEASATKHSTVDSASFSLSGAKREQQRATISDGNAFTA